MDEAVPGFTIKGIIEGLGGNLWGMTTELRNLLHYLRGEINCRAVLFQQTL
jgi:hypothetical protein